MTNVSQADLENVNLAHVMVTCGGGLQGLTVFKSIGALEGISTHLFDSKKENVSRYFYDHFFQSTPVKDERKYEEELLAYVEKHRIDLIVPATQFDLWLLSRKKTAFLQRFNCKVAVPEQEFLALFLDKKKSNRFLAERGFPVQPEKDPISGSDFPLIGKPLDGWGGKGMVMIQSQVEFIKSNYPVDKYLWTSYLKEFKEYSIDFSVNHKGAVSLPVARERISVSGGIALISKSVEIPHMLNELITVHFAKSELSGIYNLQYVSCPEGWYVTDLNPRIGTSAVLGKRIGSNPIAHLLELPTQEQRAQAHVKVIRYLEEKYLVEGDESDIEKSRGAIQHCSLMEAAKQEGRAESKMEIAKEMKRDGFVVSQISRYTGLEEQEIVGL